MYVKSIKDLKVGDKLFWGSRHGETDNSVGIIIDARKKYGQFQIHVNWNDTHGTETVWYDSREIYDEGKEDPVGYLHAIKKIKATNISRIFYKGQIKEDLGEYLIVKG